MRNKSFAWIGMAVLAIGISISAGAAQTQPAAPANQDGVVAVGGVSILTIRFASEGMSIKERADKITDRLRFMLGDPDLKPSDIVAAPRGADSAVITVKGRLLVTIEAQTAQFNSTTALKLAQSWTHHLRRAILQVNVQPNASTGEPRGNK
jgi:hypothetical protein